MYLIWISIFQVAVGDDNFISEDMETFKAVLDKSIDKGINKFLETRDELLKDSKAVIEFKNNEQGLLKNPSFMGRGFFVPLLVSGISTVTSTVINKCSKKK